MEQKKHHEHLMEACLIIGGQSRLARLLNVKSPTVNQWIFLRRKIPAKRCPEIERLVDGRVICEQLRPDINWSYLRQVKVNDHNNKAVNE